MYLKAEMQDRRPRLAAQRSSASEEVPEGLLTVARQFHWRGKAGSRNRVPGGTPEPSAKMRNVFRGLAGGNVYPADRRLYKSEASKNPRAAATMRIQTPNKTSDFTVRPIRPINKPRTNDPTASPA
jgi:hypothetical protein